MRRSSPLSSFLSCNPSCAHLAQEGSCCWSHCAHAQPRFQDHHKAANDAHAFIQTLCTSRDAGTGFCAAKALLAKGAHVVVLNRSSDRADAALQSLTKAAPSDSRITSVTCDLLNFDSVRDAGATVVGALEEEGVGLDGLVCNAGVHRPPRPFQ